MYFFRLIILFTLMLMFASCKPNVNKTTDVGDTMFDLIEKSNQRQFEYQKQFGGRTNELVFPRDIFVAFVRQDVTNFNRFHADNPAYQKVSREWINKEFTPNLWRFFVDTHVLQEYDLGTFDCKHYSFGAYYYGNDLHRNEKTHINGASLAIGIIYYVPDNHGGEAHAINALILEDKSVVFYEPQNQSIVSLSLSERNSIYCIQF
jgi:hypothetical protein